MSDKQEEIIEVKEEAQQPETIKLGDAEYSQDELNDLVGLGKIAKEAEEKYNVKIDGIWPKFQQTINENGEFRKKQEEFDKHSEQEQLIKKAGEGVELSESEQIALAAQKIREMGFYTKDDVAKEVSNIMAGRELLDQVNKLVDEQSQVGNPKTNAEELLSYMDENGIKNPSVAYKLRFEKELDEIKASKLGGIKKDQFVTEEGGGTGNKLPRVEPVTRANLTDALSDVLNRES
jgi:hypothetical protein